MGSPTGTEPVAIILGSYPFPYGNASANRMLSLAKTWKAAGWRPLVINDQPDQDETACHAVVQTVREVEYINLRAPASTRWQRLQRRRSLAARVIQTLDGLDLREHVTHMVFPSMLYGPCARRRLRRALPRGTTVVDVVERHDSSQFRLAVFHPYYLRHRLTSWYTGRRADKVIVISQALAEGPFSNTGPLVLPPCVDVDEFQEAAGTVRSPSPVAVTYFGSPGTKDDLSALLKAVPILTVDERSRLRLTLAGFDAGQVVSLPGLTQKTVDACGDTLQFAGRLNREEVLELLSLSHYSFLLRDPFAGYAKYGFPSKVPESLAAGCPIIGNLTSDLGSYLADGENALLVDSELADSHDPVAVAKVLTRAIRAVMDGTYAHLGENARITAQASFDALSWGPQLNKWLLR